MKNILRYPGITSKKKKKEHVQAVPLWTTTSLRSWENHLDSALVSCILVHLPGIAPDRFAPATSSQLFLLTFIK